MLLSLVLALFLGPLVTLLAVTPGAAGAGTARRSSVPRSAGGRQLDPRQFEPGACVEYPPTSGDRKLTVFLDAGHGGLDPGGVGTTESGQTVYEADETLPVELDTMKLLRAEGFTVVVSRTRDETVLKPGPADVSEGLFTAQGVHDDVAARDVCANKAKANVLVGIYFDAGGSSYDAGSVTGYDTARTFTAQNLRLATLVQSDVLNAMNAQGWGIPGLGVVDDSVLGGPALTTAAADYGHLLLLGPAEPGLGAELRGGSAPSSPARGAPRLRALGALSSRVQPSSAERRGRCGQLRAREISAFCNTAALTPAARQVP